MTPQPPIEIELKLVLANDHAHATLQSWLDRQATAQVAIQSNRYLDSTDRLLAARRVMLRIRLTSTAVVCTAKAGASMVEGLMQVNEWQQTLQGDVAASWRGGRSGCQFQELPIFTALQRGPLADVADAGARRLHVIGVMQTTRRVYVIPAASLGLAVDDDAIQFELDHSLFPDGAERFELEIEHPDAAVLRPAITALLDRLELDWQPARISKYQQFLEAQAKAPGMLGDHEAEFGAL